MSDVVIVHYFESKIVDFLLLLLLMMISVYIVVEVVISGRPRQRSNGHKAK